MKLAVTLLCLGAVVAWAADDPLQTTRKAWNQQPRPAGPTSVPKAPGGRGSAIPVATPLPRGPVSTSAERDYQPAKRADGRKVVALDIGHTVAQPGAFSATGVGEFSFNKRIVELLNERLEASATVVPVVINPKGAAIRLPERTRQAAKAGASLFVSIHHDSAQDKYLLPWEVNGKPQRYTTEFHGYGVFTSLKNAHADRSLAFARLLGREISVRGFRFADHHNEPIPGENRPIVDRVNGVYRYDDLIVLKTALMPAVLLECGVIANPDEEKRMCDPTVQAQIVDAISTAIERYFDSPPEGEQPRSSGLIPQ